MADLLELSSRMIDSGVLSEPANRVINELSEVADDVAVIESFSHVVVFRTADGLMLFDTTGAMTARAAVAALRGWTGEPIHTIVYTHGHVDHVGGSGAFVADGRERGHRDPRVVGHVNVPRRMDRYDATNGWNVAINARQFGGVNPAHGMGLVSTRRFLPEDTVRCTDTFDDRLQLRVGDLLVELRHDKGETDDHAWAWIPARNTVCVGDFLTWVFPNAGNPQKVQRYPGEWATALRQMAALGPELLLPAHGLPIAGAARIGRVLDDLATALERIVRDVVAMMNDGCSLDEIVHTVRLGDEVLSLPYMRPVYDEPEFVVRNVWRLYGGWWDGNPARLKPAPDGRLAAELAALAGGIIPFLDRARALADAGDHRLACHLVELAVQAEPDSAEAHAARAEVYAARRRVETSLMAKGVYAAAARESQEKAHGRPDTDGSGRGVYLRME